MTATLQIKKNRPNYYVLIRYKDETTGKERQKWIQTDIAVKGNNKRKAEKKLREVLAEYEQDGVDLGKDILFTDFIKIWLENLKPSISPVTYDGYYLVIYNQVIPYFEPKKLKVQEITPLHIQQYINFKLKKVSPNTVIKHIRNISKYLNSAVRQNIIPFNPAQRIDLPKKVPYTGAQFYNERQIEQLLVACKGDILEPIVLFAVFYGLRRSEILGLKWNAIDDSLSTFTVKHTVIRIGQTLHKQDSTKYKSSYRVMPIPEMIANVLRGLRENQLKNKALQPKDYIDEGYVFTQADGRLIAPCYVTTRFKRIIRNNNLPPVRFHDLRHSSASYLLHLGFSMKEIQMWLGHSDIGTSMNIYTHLDINAKKNIADNLNTRFAKMGNGN